MIKYAFITNNYTEGEIGGQLLKSMKHEEHEGYGSQEGWTRYNMSFGHQGVQT
jgi:hypothetical protein